ncbi:GNAT family N-acetyltransferase [Sulfuricurvum sp.]|uniref:GNAT family N-acetyltransferase n=1 Tax=Sulfuricurvum sp. TaxID=2025608 RepID=UPI002D336341|nr:GNAT family N-acetyltransferase [Sulfuricurvum sp.]HZF71437.1 GNAT family N-acetyltransferase [Sulfuricurvum sp.]
MTIQNSIVDDIDEIFRLYIIATEFQKSKFFVHWPEFDRSLIETEITENRQWKMVIDDQIACIWATTFSDHQIWGEKDSDPALYIHRIATNPDFRGNNFVTKIVEWAEKYAQENDKKYIRMDTIGENRGLIEHYKKCGFEYLGYFKLDTIEGLPDHYALADACLFERKIKNEK